MVKSRDDMFCFCCDFLFRFVISVPDTGIQVMGDFLKKIIKFFMEML